MTDAVLNLAAAAIEIFVIVTTAVAIANSDGKGCEPGEDCKTCPFPCEHNNNTE